MTEGPVDATTTEAWRRLGELADGFQADLRAWFAEDAERASALTFTAADLLVDLSKALLNADVLAAHLAAIRELFEESLSDDELRTLAELLGRLTRAVPDQP